MLSVIRVVQSRNVSRRVSACLMSRCQFSNATESKKELYMWGTNKKGVIPTAPSGGVVDVPTLIDWKSALELSDDDDATLEKVVCGVSGTAFLLNDGRCFTCGANDQGQLGHGHKNPIEKPQLLPDIQVKDIVIGKNASAIIDVKDELYSFGFGGSTFSGMGCLGHGNGESYHTPKLVESLVEDGCFAKQVQVGEMHMTVLTNEGEVLTTGAGSYGRLGNLDTIDQLYLEPVELLSKGVTQISGGNSFTLALNKDGVVHGFGRNDKGQLGTGLGLAVDMYAMAALPTMIESDELLGRTVIKLAAGRSHAACITEGGELFYWGMTEYMEPHRVSALLHTEVVDVVCGKNYTMARGKDGKLYSFGKGKTGVLGIPNSKNLSHPEPIEALAEKNVVSMSAGYDHAACLVDA